MGIYQNGWVPASACVEKFPQHYRHRYWELYGSRWTNDHCTRKILLASGRRETLELGHALAAMLNAKDPAVWDVFIERDLREALNARRTPRVFAQEARAAA